MNPKVLVLILKVLQVFGAALKLAPELQRRKAAYLKQIEQMIAEGRGPSDEEVDALLAEGDEITAALEEAAANKSS